MNKIFYFLIPGGLLLLIASQSKAANKPAGKWRAPMKLSKNFDLAEILITGRHEKLQSEAENAAFRAALKSYALTDLELENVKILVNDVLQPARDELGLPIVITGGARPLTVRDTKGRNLTDLLTLEGLAPSQSSDHIYFAAVDVHPEPKTDENLKKLFEIFKRNPKVRQVLYEYRTNKQTGQIEPTHLHIAAVVPGKPRFADSQRAFVMLDGARTNAIV